MSERWITPPEIFDPLMDEFDFDLDAAADTETKRCFAWLGPGGADDALSCPLWPGERVWMNPPYGRKLESFVRKAAEQAALGKTVIALIPFRCRAAWWHECVLGKAAEVRCIRKRVRFIRPDGSRPKMTGSCDSCIVVWLANRFGSGTRIVPA